jgi:hypothetical protein
MLVTAATSHNQDIDAADTGTTDSSSCGVQQAVCVTHHGVLREVDFGQHCRGTSHSTNKAVKKGL